jgi:hypothetical protein
MKCADSAHRLSRVQVAWMVSHDAGAESCRGGSALCNTMETRALRGHGHADAHLHHATGAIEAGAAATNEAHHSTATPTGANMANVAGLRMRRLGLRGQRGRARRAMRMRR